MDTIQLDFEDRRRMAFAALMLRAERIMQAMPDDPSMWFFTDSDVLDVAEAWTVSDLDVECVMDSQGDCVAHADYHLLSAMAESFVKAVSGGGER